MYEIGCAIIFCVNLLCKLIGRIDKLRQRIFPRYRFRCFNRAYNSLHIAGENEWNSQVLEILMDDFGYAGKRRET